MTIEVFELERILDNPLFEGFASGDTPSLLGRNSIHDDFFPELSVAATWDWNLVPLSKIWKPLVVEGRVRSFNDFPCLDLMTPAFSRRAVDVLRDFLEPNGELLPLVHPAGEYYAYNCLKIVEVIDREKTKARWYNDDPRMTSHVTFFSLIPERLKGLSIFRMRQMSMRCFVTTPFVERAIAAGLNGFHFMKVWPFPEGVDYWDEDKKSRRAASLVRTESGAKDIKAESMILQLPLAGLKLSKEEKLRIAAIEDEIDALLFTPTLETPYCGSLEGKKTSKGVTKIYLSCPNSQQLFQKLADWLNTLKWSPRPKVIVRTIPYDDVRNEGQEISV
jgi:hypothetical protein